MIGILLVGLAAVFALARRREVHLPASRRERAGILAAHAEQHDLGDVAEVEADAAPVGAAVLAHLVPDEVGFVRKPQASITSRPSRQQRVRHPEIKVRGVGCESRDRQGLDLGEVIVP